MPTYLYIAAATIPLVVAQETLRVRSFGAQRAQLALLSDVTWLIVFLPWPAISFLVATPGAGGAVVISYAGGALCAVVALWFATRRMRGRGETSTLGSTPLTVEASLTYGLSALTPILASTIVPLSVIGTARSALIAVTPLSLYSSLAQTIAIPRIDLSNARSVAKVALQTTAVAISATGALVLILFALPTAALETVGFPPNAEFRLCVVLLGLGFSMGSGMAIWLTLVRRSWGWRRWLPLRAAIAVVELAATLLLGRLIGAPGLASNILVANSCLVVATSRYKGLRSSSELRPLRVSHRDP
ncbi:hypothetical protein [Nocardioides iriomotensis]|uniref:Polysaccharide biosynthesis protein n=1 Tax=Nocardioides iriomotensis TaxID=715784 RepID=A0A4Q5J7D2_9ACTN|nr:hypothetical protein [Nocardioides iriomotensis]RYU13689.1 hypothetical protein ETU37_05460 [Nocardioides iriomotensis]